MEVMITAFKRFFGKVKKINKKEVGEGESFWTPPCKVYPIPSGTVYYEIILEKGALKKIMSVQSSEVVDYDIKLTFFAMWGRADLDLEKGVAVGEKCCFFTQIWGKGYWVNNWKKLNNNE